VRLSDTTSNLSDVKKSGAGHRFPATRQNNHLTRELGACYRYVSFDDPLTRDFAITDPNWFLDQYRDRPAVLDETQNVPEILPYTKSRVDQERRRYGHWVLTGSQQFALMQNVSELLAGRVALLELQRPGAWAAP
jgi:hypothetical protein